MHVFPNFNTAALQLHDASFWLPDKLFTSLKRSTLKVVVMCQQRDGQLSGERGVETMNLESDLGGL